MTKKYNKPYKNQEFLDLRNKWYAKLKKKGFKDIEWFHKDKPDPVSHRFIGHGSFNSIADFRRKYDPEREELFLRWRQWSFEYPVRSREHKVMNMYGNGMSQQEIAKELGISTGVIKNLLHIHKYFAINKDWHLPEELEERQTRDFKRAIKKISTLQIKERTEEKMREIILKTVKQYTLDELRKEKLNKPETVSIEDLIDIKRARSK